MGINESKDQLIPKSIPGFVERSNPVMKVVAGPTCGMLLDERETLHVWGKWKNSGDGGQGTPWMYPKYFSGLSGWKVRDFSCGSRVDIYLGAFSLFATADTSCISWGQGCSHGGLCTGS